MHLWLFAISGAFIFAGGLKCSSWNILDPILLFPRLILLIIMCSVDDVKFELHIIWSAVGHALRWDSEVINITFPLARVNNFYSYFVFVLKSNKMTQPFMCMMPLRKLVVPLTEWVHSNTTYQKSAARRIFSRVQPCQVSTTVLPSCSAGTSWLQVPVWPEVSLLCSEAGKHC